jgi:hypothetical protein
MQGVKIGNRVRFRPGSDLPGGWKLPADAIGTVFARHDAIKRPGRIWLDLDFGPAGGFLWSVDATDFERVT